MAVIVVAGSTPAQQISSKNCEAMYETAIDICKKITLFFCLYNNLVVENVNNRKTNAKK